MDKKIIVKICVGTYCYVMGGYKLKDLKSKLPSHLVDKVKVEASVCLGCDKSAKPIPPYAEIDGELMEEASIEKITKKIESLIR